MDDEIMMTNVEEHCEGNDVFLAISTERGGPRAPKGPQPPRLVVRALNECGYKRTEVDLIDLLNWLHDNRATLPAEVQELLS